MGSAREWSASQLIGAWVAMGVVVAVARRLFIAGVYEAQIDGQRVVIVSGLWTASFASAATALVVVVGFAAMAWHTYSWLSGARDRRRMENVVGGPHRGPLI